VPPTLRTGKTIQTISLMLHAKAERAAAAMAAAKNGMMLTSAAGLYKLNPVVDP
jgi:hypothetical protein